MKALFTRFALWWLGDRLAGYSQSRIISEKEIVLSNQDVLSEARRRMIDDIATSLWKDGYFTFWKEEQPQDFGITLRARIIVLRPQRQRLNIHDPF